NGLSKELYSGASDTTSHSVSRDRRSSRHRLRRPKGLTRQGGATAQVRQPHLTYNPKTPWHRKC
ncbi:hypothetical protein BD309DRAFT_952024, partial [Dichomitus squalens]